MLLIQALAVLLFVGRSVSADDDPIVEMPLGKVRGFTMTSRSGRKFLAFSAIPYAKPPIGELRFQPPEAVPLWRGIRDAKEELPICIQRNTMTHTINSSWPLNSGIEDCLYLSVYTHSISGNAPVLFHIHGGAFVMGAGYYTRPEYLMDEDMVIVNINYRVGIFGFLSFESPELPGNQGMKDQVMALRWVQQNIASFGGDPNQVTIIGESGGSAAVYHHIISPLSKGLFHKAIAESGTSYCPWAVAPPGLPRSRAERLAAALGCPTNPEQAIPCLVKKDSYEVLSKLPDASDGPFEFIPVIEEPGANSFIVGTPSKWSHNPVPVFMGMTSAEGLMFTFSFSSKDFDFKEFSRNFNQKAPLSLLYYATASDPGTVTKELRKFYLPNEEITLKEFVNITNLMGDSFMNMAVLEGADKHKGDVYFYHFDYIPTNYALLGLDEKLIFGAIHNLEYGFIWNVTANDIFPKIDSEEDLKMSKSLIKIILSFMKNGVPTIEESDVKWKKWTAGSHEYIHIDSKGFHLRKGLIEERYKFWKGLSFREKMETPMKK